jgi:hypothetical protein
MSECARSSCHNPGTFHCSGCQRELYCGIDCQKGDWRCCHKKICKILKKFSRRFQPCPEVLKVIMETREENIRNKQLEARVLQQLVSYTEFQCGNRVIGGASREWGNGDHIEGDSLLWKLEIDILFPNYEILYLIYQKDETLSMIARANLMFPFCQKMLGLLKPWSINFDLNSTSRVNNLDKNRSITC